LKWEVYPERDTVVYIKFIPTSNALECHSGGTTHSFGATVQGAGYGARSVSWTDPSPAPNRMPAPASARSIKVGARRPAASFPASKLRTVKTLTPAARARSAGDQFKRVRAFRHCCGLMSPTMAYNRRKNATSDARTKPFIPVRSPDFRKKAWRHGACPFQSTDRKC
jgi:hypothetical protein